MTRPAAGRGVSIASISPDATPEEVAAITAAVAAVRRRGAVVPPSEPASMWVHATRRSAQRSGLQRGPWRLSGRLPRRART